MLHVGKRGTGKLFVSGIKKENTFDVEYDLEARLFILVDCVNRLGSGKCINPENLLLRLAVGTSAKVSLLPPMRCSNSIEEI